MLDECAFNDIVTLQDRKWVRQPPRTKSEIGPSLTFSIHRQQPNRHRLFEYINTKSTDLISYNSNNTFMPSPSMSII